MLDWNDLRFVLETARNGGTSGAARVLGVNHATVARRISAAEAALGERLFDRLPSGYVPTEAGLEAVRTAEAMAQLDSELDLKIAARDDRIKGRLRVTAPQLLIQRVLGDILADFVASYPEVDLELVATNDPLNLAQREADVAIRFSHDPPEALVGRRFIEQKGAVYATPDFVARDPGGEAPLDWVRFAHWPDLRRKSKQYDLICGCVLLWTIWPQPSVPCAQALGRPGWPAFWGIVTRLWCGCRGCPGLIICRCGF